MCVFRCVSILDILVYRSVCHKNTMVDDAGSVLSLVYEMVLLLCLECFLVIDVLCRMICSLNECKFRK